MKLVTNLSINAKNRRLIKDDLGLLQYLENNKEKFQKLEKEYSMIINNLGFMSSSTDDADQDDANEKLFLEFLAKPIQGS